METMPKKDKEERDNDDKRVAMVEECCDSQDIRIMNVFLRFSHNIFLQIP